MGIEPRAILARDDESLNHLGIDEVAVELVEFVEPEFPPAEVRVRNVVRVATQIAVVLHQDERSVELRLPKVGVLGHTTERRGAARRRVVGRQFIDELSPLRSVEHASGSLVEQVNKLRRCERKREGVEEALPLDELQGVGLLVRFELLLPAAQPAPGHQLREAVAQAAEPITGGILSKS